VTEADLVIGLYSDNDAASMELAVAKASGGAARYHPELRSVLVCSDAASTDGSREAFFSVPSETPRIYVSTSGEDRSKKACFFNLVAAAAKLGARAVVAYDASTPTIKKTWLPRLLDPVLENGACYTAPIYARHLFDLPVTYLLSYPLFRALFGRRIRNVHQGDCAFSGALNEVFLNAPAWPEDPHFCAVELTCAALASSNGPVFQSFMADPRVDRTRAPVDTGIGEEFCWSLRAFLQLMRLYPNLWRRTRNSRPTPVIGTGLKPDILPARELEGPPGAFQELISASAVQARGVWEDRFAGHMELWRALKDPPPHGVSVPAADWADLIYTGAAAWRHMDAQDGDRMIRALMPVFLARLLAFKKATSVGTLSQISAAIEGEAEVFEKSKPKLLSLWGE
jgi:hypothetical protein